MRFESENDLIRENKAIETFVDIFNGFYKKLDQNDIDFAVYDTNFNLICYVEIKGRNKNIIDSYPLPISAKKFIKLFDKKINPVIIWACLDGIIYAKIKDLKGYIKWGGRTPRYNSFNDLEFMIYFYKQDCMKYIKY